MRPAALYRRRTLKGWITLVTCLVLLGAAEPAAALPDLTISLPHQPNATEVAPTYVDAFDQPGHLLYRFDAVIHNDGSTLDVFRRESDGHVMQALWKGDPDVAPDPFTAPTNVPLDDRTAHAGAHLEFVIEPTHQHFHFFTAARYELAVPGAKPRVSPKIGFCLSDSFGGAPGVVDWFSSDKPWCHAPDGRPGFTRMGLSTGSADRYAAQVEFQYVDISGLAPDTYKLRGIANPEGSLLESDGVPDVYTEARFIPGAVADDLQAGGSGGPVPVHLSGRARGLDVPARISGSCAPRQNDRACYVWAHAGDPLRYDVAAQPAHGSVAVSGDTATYTPAPGFVGDDRFTYTATDVRGLVSSPATVTVKVLRPGTVVVDPPSRRIGTLATILSARQAGRRAVVVRIRCKPSAIGACAGRIAARARGRSIGTGRFSGLRPGRARNVRIRHTPTRRRMTVRAFVRDALGPGLPVSRNVR
jgi:hypothetical protein